MQANFLASRTLHDLRKKLGADLPPPGSSKVQNMPGGQIELNPHYMLKRLKAIDGWRREQSFQGYWIYSETFGEQAVLWSDLNIYWFGKYIRPTTILKINWLNRINKIKTLHLIHWYITSTVLKSEIVNDTLHIKHIHYWQKGIIISCHRNVYLGQWYMLKILITT